MGKPYTDEDIKNVENAKLLIKKTGKKYGFRVLNIFFTGFCESYNEKRIKFDIYTTKKQKRKNYNKL